MAALLEKIRATRTSTETEVPLLEPPLPNQVIFLPHFEKLEDRGIDAAPAVPQLIRYLDDADVAVAATAADVLADIGKDATAAIPKLIDRLGEGEIPRISTELYFHQVGVSASYALGRMGRDAVPFLVPCLSDKRSPVRSNATSALARIGPEAAPAVPALVRGLQDPDWLVRSCSAWALGKICGEPGQTIPALVKSLQDREADTRRSAAEALGKFRPTLPAAVEGLIRALEDKNGDVQDAAATALGKLGTDAIPAVPALTKTLKSKKSYGFSHPRQHLPVAARAARSLAAIGPPAKIAMPALLALIADTEGTYDEFTGFPTNNYHARGEAAVAAATIDPRSSALLPVLARSLEEDHRARNKIARALAMIGPEAKDLVPLLVKLSGPESWYGSHCAIAAAVIAPDAAAMPELLIKQLPPKSVVLDDDDWAMLTTALQKGRARLHALIPLLIGVLKDRSASQRNAARALAVFGRDAEKAVPALLDLLPTEHLRPEAIDALVRIASEQTPPLLAARKDSNPLVRSGVVEVLGHFPAGLPLVVESLADPSARVRLAAIQTLARIGPRAKPALPQIRKQLKSESRTLREAAADAILTIEP